MSTLAVYSKIFTPAGVTSTLQGNVKVPSTDAHSSCSTLFAAAPRGNTIKLRPAMKVTAREGLVFRFIQLQYCIHTKYLESYKISTIIKKASSSSSSSCYVSRQDHNMQNTGTLQSLVFFHCSNIIYCHEHIKIARDCSKKAKIETSTKHL